MEHVTDNLTEKKPWNKGKLVGQKPPLKLKEIWAIRIRLQTANRLRDLALFNLAIDRKLRACGLVRLCVRDLSDGDRIAKRTMVMQQKTQQTVQFEIMQQTREAILDWINHPNLKQDDYLFPSRSKVLHICRRDNMQGLWNHGSHPLVLTLQPMALIRSVEQKPL